MQNRFKNQDLKNRNVTQGGPIYLVLIMSKLVYCYRKDVVGRARGFLPYVGIVTIIMNEYPKFKYAVLACLGFYVLIHRE
jgi:hypothetical protein